MPLKPWGREQVLAAVLSEAPDYTGLGTESQMIFNSNKIMEENSPAQWNISGLASIPLDFHAHVSYQTKRSWWLGAEGEQTAGRWLAEMIQPGSFFCGPLIFSLDRKSADLERNQLV